MGSVIWLLGEQEECRKIGEALTKYKNVGNLGKVSLGDCFRHKNAWERVCKIIKRCKMDIVVVSFCTMRRLDNGTREWIQEMCDRPIEFVDIHKIAVREDRTNVIINEGDTPNHSALDVLDKLGYLT